MRWILPHGGSGWGRRKRVDLAQARTALTSFFSLSNSRRYDEAVQLDGGSYDVLRDWNSGVPADNRALLFDRRTG